MVLLPIYANFISAQYLFYTMKPQHNQVPPLHANRDQQYPSNSSLKLKENAVKIEDFLMLTIFYWYFLSLLPIFVVSRLVQMLCRVTDISFLLSFKLGFPGRDGRDGLHLQLQLWFISIQTFSFLVLKHVNIIVPPMHGQILRSYKSFQRNYQVSVPRILNFALNRQSKSRTGPKLDKQTMTFSVFYNF